jgi:cyclohexadienyl dehydratase
VATETFGRREIVSLLAIAPLMVSCSPTESGSSQSATLSRIIDRKAIALGYVSLAPWAVKDASGRPTGSFVDLCEAIFGPLGVVPTYLETQWSTFVAAIQSGRIDLSIVPSYPTIQRAAAVAFTNPISSLENSALVRTSDSRFRSVYDLNRPGTRVVAIEGEQSAEFARGQLGHATLRTVSSGDFSLLYSEVLAGRADAAMGYVDSIRQFAAAHPQTKDIAPGSPYSTLPICWATAYSSSELREFLNSTIAYLRGNGTLASIERRYQSQ